MLRKFLIQLKINIFDRPYNNLKGCGNGYLRFDFRCLMANGIHFIEFDGGHYKQRGKIDKDNMKVL